MTTQITTEGATIEELLEILSTQARDAAAALAEQRVKTRVEIQVRDNQIRDLMASQDETAAELANVRSELEALRSEAATAHLDGEGEVVPGEVVSDGS